jgi:GNAT superfamily N-acetyltransferase
MKRTCIPVTLESEPITSRRGTEMTHPTDLTPPLRLVAGRSREVTVRELGPDDHDVLDAVFAGLSAASRLRRFHGATPRLTAATRARLAAVDGHRHIAVAAFAAGVPIGIARLVGFGSGPPGRVELAVEVVDAWQGRGVGSRLVRQVLALGRAAGHTEVVAEVLADNYPVQGLLFAALPHLSWVGDGPELTFLAPLPALPSGGVAA